MHPRANSNYVLEINFVTHNYSGFFFLSESHINAVFAHLMGAMNGRCFVDATTKHKNLDQTKN